MSFHLRHFINTNVVPGGGGGNFFGNVAKQAFGVQGLKGTEEVYRGFKTHNTGNAERAAAAAQAATVGSTNDRIARIRALYGIDPTDVGGAGMHAGLAGEAASNKAVIDRLLGNQETATLKTGGNELDQRFAGVQRGNEQNLADRGLSGGSVDQGASRSTLADFLKGKTDLALAASNEKSAARGNLDQQRMGLETQVLAGGDPTTINTLTQQSSAINQAGANVVPNALAGVLQQGANVYAQGQVANAYGRRGLPGSTPYVPRVTGSYT
jgi:hypothetical protein